jgi:tetratricopeptide (TPR) repeat protein
MMPAADVAPSSVQRSEAGFVHSAGLAVVLLALTVMTYWPAMHNGYIWDDDVHVQWNRNLRTARGLARIWFDPGATPQYYPLTHTSFWIQYQLWGSTPGPYHVINVLLHAISAVLVWRILRRLRVPGAWLAGAIFAIHPVQVESVAWVTERKNVLSGVFYLLSLAAYTRFEPERFGVDRELGESDRKWIWYAMALLLFVAALLSKTVTSTLPAALLLMIWWKSGRLRWKDFWPLAPWFALSLCAGSLTGWMERHIVGAWGADWQLSIVQRIAVAGGAIWFYAVKLIWPIRLMFIYPRWDVDPPPMWMWLCVGAALGIIGALFLMRNRLGRGPLTGVLFFVGTLVPALGFVNVYPMRFSFVADHFQYLASLGLIALAAAGLSWIGRWLPGISRGKWPWAVMILAPLAVLSWRHEKAFADPAALWRDTLSKNDRAWMAHGNLGVALLDLQSKETGQAKSQTLDEARRHLLRAIELRADFTDAYLNLALVSVRRKNFADAEQWCRDALSHYPTAPAGSPIWKRRAKAYQYLGWVLAAQSQPDSAMSAYREGLKYDPDQEGILNGMGEILSRKGDFQAAVDCYRRALRANSDLKSARTGLADALNQLGMAAAGSGNLSAAENHLREAVAVDPNQAEAFNNLGAILAQQNRLDEAIECFRQAVRIRPDFEAARNNLASAMAQQRGGGR